MSSNSQRLLLGVLAGLLLALSALADDLPVIQLQIDDYPLSTELAVTPDERSLGLMHRETLPDDAAMLFVYSAPASRCFWMRNTLIPLTVAFLAEDGRVLQLADMEPLSEEIHCSDLPVRFALEVNQGWFEQRSLGVGDRVQGLP
ncbi:MAG: DUF192 domain-containing protein [Natronospirillum sp.]|uniref:DUF192 domain-containing protein n=1 Tax=Natronospirillum sp. TaxID=2812955 RepID=UPI0025E83CBD|nr:DUF192 domain-containing protein [Natronospirillum sp.]MCH8553016.1 DUF192 domain-containing protein [Natronospirillum sp.]